MAQLIKRLSLQQKRQLAEAFIQDVKNRVQQTIKDEGTVLSIDSYGYFGYELKLSTVISKKGWFLTRKEVDYHQLVEIRYDIQDKLIVRVQKPELESLVQEALTPILANPDLQYVELILEY